MIAKPILIAALASVVISGSAVAGQLTTPAKTAPVATTTAAAAQSGVQAAIDPATGRLRAPTDADRAALSNVSVPVNPNNTAFNSLPKDEAAAAATLRLNPSKGIEATMQVPQSLFSNLVVERQADGTLKIHHEGDDASTATPEATQ
jgi:hypothetical protein